MVKIVFFRVCFKDDTGDTYIDGILGDIEDDEQVLSVEKAKVG